MVVWARRAVLAAATLGGFGALTASPAGAVSTSAVGPVATRVPLPVRQDLPAVVLVHGAFNDASSWSGVIARLQAARVQVRAVQIPLLSLAGDVAVVRREVEAIGRPVVLVGHSYAGGVISGASGVCPDVTALVYCAAAVLDEGQSGNSAGSQYPPTPVAQHIVVDAAGFVTVTPEGFVTTVAGDVPAQEAWVRAVSQKPLYSGTGDEVCGPVGWHRLPCYYQLSTRDQVISVQAQQDAAARLKAQVLSLPASHLSPVSRPAQITALIQQALTH